MLGLEEDKVRIVPYDPVWPELYEQEKELLQRTFGKRILAIEHVGSTAVPGLAAKPIIDIAVAVESVETVEDVEDFYSELARLGYKGFQGQKYKHTRFFLKKADGVHVTHHVGLTTLESENGWKNKIIFRDYLRAHPEARAEYEELKRMSADTYPDDREKYTEEKNEFIKKILEKTKI
jgi:GrpB-like predicted nucleotidyltransferase (UPF0157 family)